MRNCHSRKLSAPACPVGDDEREIWSNSWGQALKNLSKTESKSIFDVSFFDVYRPVFWDPALTQGLLC